MHFAAIVIISALGAVGMAALIHGLAFLAVAAVAPAAHLDRALYLGLCLGVMLASAARIGSAAKLRPQFYAAPGLRLLFLIAFAGAFGAASGFLLVRVIGLQLWEPHFSNLPLGGDAPFFAALCAQFGAAGAALLGTVALARTAWKVRSAAGSLGEAGKPRW